MSFSKFVVFNQIVQVVLGFIEYNYLNANAYIFRQSRSLQKQTKKGVVLFTLVVIYRIFQIVKGNDEKN